MRKPLFYGISIIIILIATVLLLRSTGQTRFDGQRAWRDVAYQVGLGPRIPGSLAHSQALEFYEAQLTKAGWDVERQTLPSQQLVQVGQAAGRPGEMINLIARRGSGRPWIILGAHYDSRIVANQDPDPANRSQPVPGANDGGSGVAVLLELARVLPANLDRTVWLVFFDAEDNGSLPNSDWSLGARGFVEALPAMSGLPTAGALPNVSILPDAVVILDMVGDADLNLYYERNSDPLLSAQIWQQAAELGYDEWFIPQDKHRIIDDHLPFVQAGIPAVDIIDFDYPAWHTLADTPDKVSAASLQAVGETVRAWLLRFQP